MPSPSRNANGPAADYPVVVGDPFTIEGTTYTPSEQLNYDAVGYASVSAEVGKGTIASHKTLPLPSYAEVTSLESGRTILVRVETRGPMINERLLELSPAAAAQLGIGDRTDAPVRVRRVNPPEPERAMLRAGKPAPERMETPEPLLKVLNRKLVENSPLSARRPVPPASEPPAPAADAPPEFSVAVGPDAKPDPPVVAAAVPEPSPAADTPPKVEPKATPLDPSREALAVQVAAFSTQTRAASAAKNLGAIVSKPGKYWYVRLGPYANRADASAGLAKAKAAGYGDARIVRAN